eukprot:16444304-Heterocapsa_arctica.AAC.1
MAQLAQDLSSLQSVESATAVSKAADDIQTKLMQPPHGISLGRGSGVRAQSVPKPKQAGTLSAGSGESVSATRGRPTLE